MTAISGSSASSKMVQVDSSMSGQNKFLQPEFDALAYCLKGAVVSTGRIYGFHANTHKLGIERHVSSPPQSLQASLGRNMEKYDQICDTIEARLVRAIEALKRDLKREEERVAAEERRKQVDALMLPPPVPFSAMEFVDVSSRAPSEGSSTNPRNSPVLHPMGARRQSQVSISSLHRPQFPLKLDLSSTSMRISQEEANAMFSKGGLPSPVTLAPKSARPTESNEYPADFLAAFASSSMPMDENGTSSEMSLSTLPDNMHLQQGPGLGDSSDKPIELDLDMDLAMSDMTGAFGDPAPTGMTPTRDGLFSPVNMDDHGDDLQGERADQSVKEETDILSNFNLDSATSDELFGDFNNADIGMDLDTSQVQKVEATAPDLMKPSDTPPNQSGTEFDINSYDLSHLPSNFFSNTEASDMGFAMNMDFLNSQTTMDPESNPSHDEVPPSGS